MSTSSAYKTHNSIFIRLSYSLVKLGRNPTDYLNLPNSEQAATWKTLVRLWDKLNKETQNMCKADPLPCLSNQSVHLDGYSKMRVPLAKSVINKKVVNCLKRTTATNNEVALGNIIQIMEKTICPLLEKYKLYNGKER